MLPAQHGAVAHTPARNGRCGPHSASSWREPNKSPARAVPTWPKVDSTVFCLVLLLPGVSLWLVKMGSVVS